MSGRYSAEERQQSRHSGWWWSLADNPPCEPWCELDHDPDEFRITGAIACRKLFGLLRVEVVLVAYADEDDLFRVNRQISIGIPHPAEDLSPNLARQLAGDLESAAEFVRVVDLGGSL